MPYTKSSSNWANGDVPDEADLDNWETGIALAHTTIDAIADARFSAYPSGTSSSLSSGSNTAIDADTEVFDTGSDYDTGTNAFTAPTTGLYLFTLCVEVQKTTPAAAEYIEIGLNKNAGTYIQLNYHRLEAAPAGTFSTAISGSILLLLTAGDTVKSYVRPSAGSWTYLASSSGGPTMFSGCRIS